MIADPSVAALEPITFFENFHGKLLQQQERERSIFLRGYRYTLRDHDTTWPAACESVRRI